jgi:large subunit ribosomal protein L24e
MVERRICTFCGDEIEPGTGRMYIKKDGVIFHFCTSKCFKNLVILRRVPRRTTWTRYYEREKQVRMKGAPQAPEAPKARKLKKPAEEKAGAEPETKKEEPAEKEPKKPEKKDEPLKEKAAPKPEKKPAAKKPATKKAEGEKKAKPKEASAEAQKE